MDVCQRSSPYDHDKSKFRLSTFFAPGQIKVSFVNVLRPGTNQSFICQRSSTYVGLLQLTSSNLGLSGIVKIDGRFPDGLECLQIQNDTM